MSEIDVQYRRRFLQFLAASPLLASLRADPVHGAEPGLHDSLDAPAAGSAPLIQSPDEAINVFDLERVARHELPPAHWGYLATGVDDDATLLANRRVFSRYYLRPRRLVDVSRIDMSINLFGTEWETPIVLAPAGSQGAFHEEGEVAVARAAREKRHLLILSTVSSHSVEEVIAARGGPVWYQLYPTSRWDVTRALVRRASAAGCSVLVVTIDQVTGRNRDTLQRHVRQDTRDCLDCHAPDRSDYLSRKPMFAGLNTEGLRSNLAPDLTWDIVRRLRGETDMKIILKGIVTREDAALCLEHEVDGIVVSNHGGRAEESGRASLDSLVEVVAAVEGRMPVLVDGGFRRGMDFFKALALGASAVCVGRPYLWGLAAFGQAGVERVLDILRLELELAMQTAGTPRIRDINPAFVGSVPWASRVE
jgi:isopentenyl diphosphate isomerase/L-lactate dehydrogenase-like FMN-dependent dehydrogenase